MLIDVVNDPGYQTVAGRLRSVELPDYVRQADDQAIKTAGGPHGFALSRTRKLPCGTKAACYLSHAYYYVQQDQLSPVERSEASQSLQRFAALHDIADDVGKLAQYLGPDQSDKAASAVQVARQLSHCGVENQEHQMPGQLIRAARELLQGDKTARSADFCRRWCMDMPFKRLSQDIRALKLARKDAEQKEQLDVLADKVSRLSQTQQLANIDKIADALHIILDHKTASATRDVLNDWPRQDVADVRVGRVNVPYVELESKLADIAMSTGLPVVKSGLISLPVSDWVGIVESCSPQQASRIHELLSAVAA